jgi:hypothetical protein
VNELTIAVIGAMTGSVATLIWDGVFKPILAARSLAEVLASDVSLHAQAVVAELVQLRQNPKRVPVMRPIPTHVFQSLVGRVGELPREAVGQVLALYRVFERMNEISDRANTVYARIRELPDCDPSYSTLKGQLAEEVALYGRFAENARDRINVVQPLLIKAAIPRWSPRFWQAPEPQSLDSKEVQSKVKVMRAEHERRVRDLEDKQSPGAT